MISADLLLSDMKALVRALIDDLRTLAATDAETAATVDGELRRAAAAGRTGLSRDAWAEGLFAQVAVAWVLAGVFVRFCEDNDLVPDPLLAGAGNRRAIALDHRSAYLHAHPAHDDRHWLREIAARYRALPATGDLFGDHNPIWLLAPSADGARALVQELQEIDPATGDIRHDFTDTAWDTRFLGDLYQDLSEHAKKTYALLQTPEFVEEFILDRTLEPALATFGLRETTIIDPACGSGHFLLGAFRRLFDRWLDAEPGTNPRELARRAVDGIAGVDLNPFAATIARFRLLLAALRAGGDRRLADAPTYRIHIAVGDSLLHGDPPGRLPGTSLEEEVAAAAAHGYATEDVEEARALLSRQWHAVVGNPPYITVKDPAISHLYRKRFKTCRGKYALSVPFTERFFQLGRYEADAERCGYVGMITTNSFMKREMGKDLIETWVPAHDLTHVVDTGGAYIPGHGTPTVILFGRNRRPVEATVRAVMGIRGEPARPTIPQKGLVWSSIVELIDEPGASSEYVSVVDLDRTRLETHPWSIGGGGAAELKERVDGAGRTRLKDHIARIGFGGISGFDELAASPSNTANRLGLELEAVRPVLKGKGVRDWRLSSQEEVFFPYDRGALIQIRDIRAWHERLWPYRTNLWARATFSKQTYRQEGRPWWEWHQVSHDRHDGRPLIAFANIATNNHFALAEGHWAYRETAPVISFRVGGTVVPLAVVQVLNSSVAAFWLKQVCFPKGGDQVGTEGARIRKTWWDERYAYDAAKLQEFPISSLDGSVGELFNRLARELQAASPRTLISSDIPSIDRLTRAEEQWMTTRALMISLQERLDWMTYQRYSLVDEHVTMGDEQEPPLQLGQRAFEIVLARNMAAGAEESSWFARHDSTPITQLPAHWPDSYKRLVERRIELIETDLNIGLIERPEYKRRWATKPWDEQVNVELRSWLLDRLEDGRYWAEPAALTSTARIAAQARADAEFNQVARLYARRDDVDIPALVTDLVKAEAVPYLAALRYTDSGMRKHALWLKTWELQRREDTGEDVGVIPVPPRYTKADFQGAAWDHRGKLDLPNERFISYPGASRESDPSLVIGLAGWDKLGRARALATWYLQAKRDGRDSEHLRPLLAGLTELIPWLKQWYDKPDPDPALNRPGSQITALLEAEMRALHLTTDDLDTWQPPPARRGRTRR